MSISHTFSDWQRLGLPFSGFPRCSPNLLTIRDGLAERFHVTSLGCHGRRPVRGSERTSSVHSWGAAIDLSYEALGRARAVSELIPFLVAWSGELQLGAIHDYVGCRIWRAGRTADESDACDGWWKAQRPDANGMGKAWATWLHVETTVDGWDNALRFERRGIS